MSLASKSLPVPGPPTFWVPGDTLSDTEQESGVRVAQVFPSFPKNEAWEGKQAFRPPHLLSVNSTLKSWLLGGQTGGAGVGWVLPAH